MGLAVHAGLRWNLPVREENVTGVGAWIRHCSATGNLSARSTGRSWIWKAVRPRSIGERTERLCRVVRVLGCVKSIWSE